MQGIWGSDVPACPSIQAGRSFNIQLNFLGTLGSENDYVPQTHSASGTHGLNSLTPYIYIYSITIIH